MGYVPPHLRDRSSSGSPSSARANGTSTSGLERPGLGSRSDSSASLDRQGECMKAYQCWLDALLCLHRFIGVQRLQLFSGHLAQRDVHGHHAGGKSPSSDAAAAAAAPPATWQPSARVQALSEEQRQETRTRLNIVVDDTEGSAVPPIESFDDMVKLQRHEHVIAAQSNHVACCQEQIVWRVTAECCVGCPCLQNLHANIMLDIREREYQSPTPIQAQGMPIALSGRDILGCAGMLMWRSAHSAGIEAPVAVVLCITDCNGGVAAAVLCRNRQR